MGLIGCKHLDYEGDYTDCAIETLAPQYPEVRFWRRAERWLDNGPGQPRNPEKVPTPWRDGLLRAGGAGQVRVPTQDELEGLKLMREVAGIHISSAGVNRSPATLAAVAWLDELLRTVERCDDWVIDLDNDGCQGCLGEQHGKCSPAEVLKVTEQPDAAPDGSPAPGWCVLRGGGSILMRGS